MKGIIKYTLLLWMPLSMPLKGQDSIRLDTTPLVYEEIDPGLMDRYRQDPDFAYEFEKVQNEGWWETFKARLIEMLSAVIRGTAGSGLGSWLFYILGGLALLYALMRISGLDPRSFMVQSVNQVTGQAEALDIDVQTIDFEQRIAQTVSEQDYRQAVRWLYLYALRKLSDRGVISWQPWKTNRDYLSEVGTAPYSATLGNLNYYFEYAWYGNFAIKQDLFEKVKTVFQQFQQQLETKR